MYRKIKMGKKFNRLLFELDQTNRMPSIYPTILLFKIVISFSSSFLLPCIIHPDIMEALIFNIYLYRNDQHYGFWSHHLIYYNWKKWL